MATANTRNAGTTTRAATVTLAYIMATSADEESYALESVVQRHHVYMADWTPVIGENYAAGSSMLLLLVVTDLLWDTYLSNFQQFCGIFCNMVAGFCVRVLRDRRGPLHY